MLRRGAQNYTPHQVVDLTELILANRGPLADPLIAAAGTDVSHWFSVSPSPDGKKSKSRGGSDHSGKSGARAPPTKAATANDGDGCGDGRPDECENVGDPRTFVDPHTGLTVPYLPMGRWANRWTERKIKPCYATIHASTPWEWGGVAQGMAREQLTLHTILIITR